MPYSDEPFATDEAVYRLSRGDYFPLLASSLVASGSDGAFGEDGWTFEAVGTALDTIGLVPGQIGRVRAPGAPESRWLPCAVESVEDDVLTLRRPLMADGVGQPFGATAGAGAWSWEFYSAAGTVGGASLDLRRKYRLTSDAALDSTDDLGAAAVYRSLADLYLAASKEVTAGERDTYFGKYKEFWARYLAEIGELDGVYSGGVTAPSSTPVVFEMTEGIIAEAAAYPDFIINRRRFL